MYQHNGLSKSFAPFRGPEILAPNPRSREPGPGTYQRTTCHWRGSRSPGPRCCRACHKGTTAVSEVRRQRQRFSAVVQGVPGTRRSLIDGGSLVCTLRTIDRTCPRPSGGRPGLQTAHRLWHCRCFLVHTPLRLPARALTRARRTGQRKSTKQEQRNQKHTAIVRSKIRRHSRFFQRCTQQLCRIIK